MFKYGFLLDKIYKLEAAAHNQSLVSASIDGEVQRV